MIDTTCPKCQRTLRTPDDSAGKFAKCPCGAKVQVSSRELPVAPITASPVSENSIFDDVGTLPPSQIEGPAGSGPYAVPASAVNAAGPVVQPDKSGLKSARVILIIVGLINLAMNLFLFANANKEVQELIAKGELGPNEAGVVEFLAKCLFGVFAGAGGVMIALGVLVYKMPRTCTVLGLLIYIGLSLLGLLLDPATAARGIIIKILIVVGLCKAVGTAFRIERTKV